MNPSIQLVRAIAVEFFTRVYKPITLVVFIILACLLGVSIWLVTISAWWWVLTIVLIFITLLAVVALVVINTIVRLVKPTETKDQKRQVKSLVDKMQRVAEVTATPKFILLFQVAKDVVVPSQRGYIVSVSQDALSLKDEFSNLRNSFK